VRRVDRHAVIVILVIVALCTLATAAAAGATDKVKTFALPGAAPSHEAVSVAGSWTAWNDGSALRAMDLRRGVVQTILDRRADFALADGLLAYVDRGPANDLPRRVYLYDLAAGKRYANPVPLAAGLPDTAEQLGVLLAGHTVLVAMDDSSDTSPTIMYAAAVDRKARTVGTPYAVGDPAAQGDWYGAAFDGSTLVWRNPALEVLFMDFGSVPPTFATASLGYSQVDSPPSVAGDLVVWTDRDDSDYYYKVIIGARLDPVTKTAGTPFEMISRALDPHLSGDLLVYSKMNGDQNPLMATRVTAGQTASSAVEIDRDAESAAVSGSVITYWERGASARMGAIINPKPPVSKALAAASVKSGKKATLKFRVDDQLWSATVKIVIKNAKGKTVKTIALGKRPANVAGAASFACKLPKGKYKFFVSATDILGLSVAKPASNTLTVR
jgi:hypothetical protein